MDVTILNSKGSNYDIIPSVQTSFHESILFRTSAFCRLYSSQRKADVTEVDVTINLKIALAAAESKRTGRVVELNIRKDQPIK